MTWRDRWRLVANERGHFDFGGKSDKGQAVQTTTLPGPDANERRLRDLNVQLAERQLAQFTAAEQQAAQEAADPLTAKKKELEGLAIENLLARASGRSPVLSPEQQARLDTIYGRASSEGDLQLQNFARDLAASRGMSVADSPIGHEVLDQRRRLAEGLGAQKAGASLDLGNAEALFSQATADFARQLQDRAFQNRLAMAGMTPAPYGLQQQLFGERLAQGTRSMNSSGSASNYNFGLSGQDMQGMAALGMKVCWIAAALYGAGTPEFLDAREWIMERWTGRLANLVRRFYLRFGERLAPQVAAHAWLRAVLKPLFDLAVRRTREARDG